METGNISLQYKVLLGYMILVVAVCGMVSILLYERSRMREIKTETSEIRRIRHDISTAHRYITGKLRDIAMCRSDVMASPAYLRCFRFYLTHATPFV